VVNRSASMAAHHVEGAGENMAAWTKAIRSAMVLIGMTELAEHVGLVSGDAAVQVAGEAAMAW
jgi:hypothetical protein